jgi:hypothetical protein
MSGGDAQWFYNAAADPFAANKPGDWKPYSNGDNTKIEQHFQNKSTKVELDNHVIHFHERMQVHKSDFNKQRPVKREEKI